MRITFSPKSGTVGQACYVCSFWKATAVIRDKIVRSIVHDEVIKDIETMNSRIMGNRRLK